MLIIGSTALKYWYPDFNRVPNDLDIISPHKCPNIKGIEYLADPGITKYQMHGHLSAELLLTLKCSHIFWDINFEKHMYDIQFLLNKGNKINLPIFYELYDFWNGYHMKNKRSDLDMTADDFFSNNVLNLPMPHDTIHTFLADVPAYTKILVPGEEVKASDALFNELSHRDKLNLVIEEVQVMSWERYKKMKWYNAYYVMLKKFLSMHAPMWEAVFIIENWKELTKCPINHFKLIDNKLEQWKIENELMK